MADIKIDIKEIVTEAEVQIKNLALATASRYKDQVIAAGADILKGLQTDLVRWTQMLADGQISEAEFEVLVKSYKCEIALAGLQQTGLGAVKAYELSMNILNVIIDVSLKIIDRLVKSV